MKTSKVVGAVVSVGMLGAKAFGDGGLIYQFDSSGAVIQVLVGGVLQNGLPFTSTADLAGGPT